MRKHLYLVTEHENEARVGDVMFSDQRFSRPVKNEEGPVTVIKEDKKGFEVIGQKVGLGYADFEDEDDLNERAAEVAQNKLHDVDQKWVEKAGLADAEWFNEVPA